MISFDAAQDRIAPLKDALVEAHQNAAGVWDEFVSENPAMAFPFDDTARANFIHCHIRSEITRLVSGPGIEPTDALDFFALHVGTDILLRFKFTGHGTPHNVGTTRQKHLARQEFTEEMLLTLTGGEGMEPPTLLTCGYTLDGTAIGRIEIRRDCIGQLPWAFDLFGGEAVAEPLVFPGMADDTKPAVVTSSTKKPQKGRTQADRG